MLYAFFWVIPPRLKFLCRRFGTLCVFRLHRQVGAESALPAYEDGTECSETSAYKIQAPGNYPEESIQHSEQGESLKSRMTVLFDYHHCFHLFGLGFCTSMKQPLAICMCEGREMDFREAGSLKRECGN